MSDRKWDSLEEQEFEEMLEHSVPELPPEDVIREVTPWRQSMNRVLIGLALCTLTLNFLCLNYILPAVGLVLSLLGFRALRRENRWFRGCLVLTAVRCAYVFPSLILQTTILPSSYPSWVARALTAVNVLVPFLTFFCLWRGLRAVQEKAGLPPRAGSAAALMVWCVLMCILGAVQYSGWILGWAMIAGYLLILYSLYRLSKELEETGYAIRPAPVRVADGRVAAALCLVLLVGFVCGYLFGDSYSMDWSAVETSEQTQVEDEKAHLLDLGFPEDVLNDLSPEDVAACQGALQVVVHVSDETIPDSRASLTNSVKAPDQLRITAVGVQIPGDPETWIVFHHFLWLTDPGFFGTECLQLWPTYYNSQGWASGGAVTGRVLYDRDGTTFAAPYAFLGQQTFTSSSIFWEDQTRTDIFAAFSMPRRGENYRGYVAYSTTALQEGYLLNSWANYTHQRTWLQYPAMTAMEKRMADSSSQAGAFVTVQDALQFYIDEAYD
jgi:Ca2+/Na+ antiporter